MSDWENDTCSRVGLVLYPTPNQRKGRIMGIAVVSVVFLWEMKYSIGSARSLCGSGGLKYEQRGSPCLIMYLWIFCSRSGSEGCRRALIRCFSRSINNYHSSVMYKTWTTSSLH